MQWHVVEEGCARQILYSPHGLFLWFVVDYDGLHKTITELKSMLQEMDYMVRSGHIHSQGQYIAPQRQSSFATWTLTRDNVQSYRRTTMLN